MKIVHVTPHLGGGVGTVVRGYLEHSSQVPSQTHSVVALDTLDSNSKGFLTDLGCKWIDSTFRNTDVIDVLVEAADVVLIHWWNHPLLQSLLMTHTLPRSRVLMWAHISGTPSPNNFTRFIIEYPDKLIFTTPLSFNAPEIQALPGEKRRGIGCIWSTAGVERLSRYTTHESKVERDNGNIVGYTGNLDYTKLNSDFLGACRSLEDLHPRFVVIGPLTSQFKRDYEGSAIERDMEVTGFISEESKFQLMSRFKVFGYPLARHHYATCDQAIQEAMALGAPPVVLNNPMESYMVEHGRTGLVAKNLKEYCDYLRLLLKDEDLREKLSTNCIRYANEEYSIQRIAAKWATEFDNVSKNLKTLKPCLSDIKDKKLQPSDVFTESLGNHSGVFTAHKNAKTSWEKERARAQIACLQALKNWSSPTKSTASHYYSYFREDEWLMEWSSLTLAGES